MAVHRASERPEGLVITPIFPFPPDSGGTKRTLRLLEAIDRAGVRPRVLTADEVAPARREALTQRGWRVDAVGPVPAPGTRARLLTHARAEPGLHLPQLAAAARAAVGPRTALVQAEHALSVPYLRGIEGVPLVLSTHNVDSRVERERANGRPVWDPVAWQARYRAGRLAHAERAGGRRGVVLAVSDADAAHFRRVAQRVIVAPNGVDDAFFAETAPVAGEPYVLFFGLMTYGPNLDGLRRFVAEGWPVLRERAGGLRLAIAGRGSVPACADLAAADPRISVLGLVDDIAGCARRAAAIVVPIWQGGGTRLKVLEALATGRPVVGTPLGVSGIGFRDGTHGVVAADPRGLAEALAAVLADPARSRALGGSGRELAARFRWPVVLAEAEGFYRECAERHHPRGSGARATRVTR